MPHLRSIHGIMVETCSSHASSHCRYSRVKNIDIGAPQSRSLDVKGPHGHRFARTKRKPCGVMTVPDIAFKLLKSYFIFCCIHSREERWAHHGKHLLWKSKMGKSNPEYALEGVRSLRPDHAVSPRSELNLHDPEKKLLVAPYVAGQYSGNKG
jgi:hypothetical protein